MDIGYIIQMSMTHKMNGSVNPKDTRKKDFCYKGSALQEKEFERDEAQGRTRIAKVASLDRETRASATKSGLKNDKNVCVISS
ncbi:hypothetical protein MTR_5g059515 [Medicago truncatula]|uniref:Uncharacterized protein n=1 Tax=Medicago truncatula TaxID=3880 RepID=A0A072UEF1_MEDTR|nr:hypothetical protein MTR_5g059515 [Medicago truncatula]